MADITVVTALRPEPRYLTHFGETIDSVLSQGDVDWEWNVVLDVTGLEEWPNIVPDHPKVRLLTSTGGAATARHLGIVMASSPVFRNLDGDDLLLPGGLKDALAAFDIPGVTHGLSDTVEIDGTGTIAGKTFQQTREEVPGVHDRGWLVNRWRELAGHANPSRLNTLHATVEAYLNAGGYSPVPRAEELVLMRNLSLGGRIRISGFAQSAYRSWSGGVTEGGTLPSTPYADRLYELFGCTHPVAPR